MTLSYNIAVPGHKHCWDAIKNAPLERLPEYLLNKNLEKTFETHKHTLKVAIRHIKRHRRHYLDEYIESRIDDEWWRHRYTSLFNDLKSGNGKFALVYEYYEHLLRHRFYNFEYRKKFLESFTKRYMSQDLHSYIAAEVLRPLVTIILEVVQMRLQKKPNGFCQDVIDDILQSLTAFMEIDIRLCVLMAESNVYRTIDQRRAAIKNKLFYLGSLSGSDKIQNHFGTLINDFREIATAIKTGDNKKVEKFLNGWTFERFDELDMLTINLGRQFSSHGKGRTLVSHFVFLINHIFASQRYSFSFSGEYAFGELEILVEEFSLLEIIYPILENANDAGAKNINVIFTKETGVNNLIITFENDGKPISEFEKEHAFKRFFSCKTPRKQGLGLFLAKQEAKRLGGHICFTETESGKTAVSVIFPIHKPSSPKSKKEI